MPPDLNSYIASRYLVADQKSKRKRKRTEPTDTGLIITEEGGLDWLGDKPQSQKAYSEDEPVLVSGTSSDFRKTKSSNWRPLNDGTSLDRSLTGGAEVTAKSIQVDAALTAGDEIPVFADGLDNSKMTDATSPGLQSGASVLAQLEPKRHAAPKDVALLQLAGHEETAYRDAAGNRIDISMKRALARHAVLEAKEKDERSRDTLKGEVQKMEAQKRREQIQDARYLPVARAASDVELNHELKDQERWNDPMAPFLKSAQLRSSTPKFGQPTYRGLAVPNRYGIHPGYRWDGVDRGNGFEGQRFKFLNKRNLDKELQYSWQIDV